jgi:hypothetical protein
MSLASLVSGLVDHHRSFIAIIQYILPYELESGEDVDEESGLCDEDRWFCDDVASRVCDAI